MIVLDTTVLSLAYRRRRGSAEEPLPVRALREMILEDIHTEVGAVPGIDRIEVEVVWGPPWTKDKITKRGRRVLVAHGVAV